MIGGLSVYIRNTVSCIDDSFEFVIVHGEKDNSAPVLRYGKPVREYKVKLYRKLNPINDLVCLFQTIRIILKEKPDAIHCHSAKGGVIGRIAGRICGIKTFYTPHAFSFLSTQSKIKRYVYIRLEKFCRFNSSLLACSESERQLGISKIHYKDNHAFCWNNSVPDIRLDKIQSKKEKYICYIGRPSYQKNPFFLIDVISSVHKVCPEMKFYLLGVGYYSPDLDKMKRQITDENLEDTIILLPWLSHDQAMLYLKNSLLYLTVSKYEGLPLSVIEAMCLSKAVIASDVLGNRDCVRDGYNGRLLPLDVSKFSSAIVSLIENDELRHKFERNSREFFESSFLIDNRISFLEKIYRTAIVEKGKSLVYN